MSTRLRNTIRFEVLKETIIFKDRSFSLEDPLKIVLRALCAAFSFVFCLCVCFGVSLCVCVYVSFLFKTLSVL